MDIFEPMTIISAMYIVMYFVTPIYDICVGEFWWFGYELFKYSVEATLIGFAGHGSYSDLVIWAGWCLINAVLALVVIIKNEKTKL